MKIKPTQHSRPQCLGVWIFILCSALLPLTASAQPQKPGSHVRQSPGRQWRGAAYPRPGVRVRALPRNHRTLRVGPLTYFFLEGIFYRPEPEGFVVVSPPQGARVVSLPESGRWVVIGGRSYYSYAGVYYQKVADGYVVTQPGQQITSDTASAWEGDKVRVTARVLNVRSGPGKNHSIVRQVQQNDILLVQSANSHWYYVKLPDGSFGWVMVKYTIKVQPEAKG